MDVLYLQLRLSSLNITEYSHFLAICYCDSLRTCIKRDLGMSQIACSNIPVLQV